MVILLNFLVFVKKLIEKGANVDFQNYIGKMALMYASKNGHTNVVEKLIEKIEEDDDVMNVYHTMEE